MPILPFTREAEAGGSLELRNPMTALGNTVRPHLLKDKD